MNCKANPAQHQDEYEKQDDQKHGALPTPLMRRLRHGRFVLCKADLLRLWTVDNQSGVFPQTVATKLIQCCTIHLTTSGRLFSDRLAFAGQGRGEGYLASPLGKHLLMAAPKAHLPIASPLGNKRQQSPSGPAVRRVTSRSAGASREVRQSFGLAVLTLVLFLTFLDNTVVSVTLSSVQSSLHAGITGLQWVVGAYVLVFASFMLPAGTVSDLLGRKRVMLTGVVVFCIGSLVAAIASSTEMLWAGRAVMGLGAAASEPGTLSMIRHIYPERQSRAVALGVWAAVSGLALAAGPILGGVFVGVWNWRAVFLFNLAFGLVALVGAAAVLPESSDPVDRRIDVPGFVLGVGSLACVTFAVIAGETSGYGSWWIVLLFALAAAAAVCFVVVELRAANPMLNVRLFRLGPFSASTFVAFATYFGVFSIFFFVALYLEVVGSQSGYRIALDFAPMAAAMIVASVLTGRWVAKRGPRVAMALGCLLGGAGIVLTDVLLTPGSGIATIGWPLAVAGLGFGMAIVPVTTTTLAVVPSEHSGMAASASNTSRELGAVAGVAILGSVVNGQLTVSLAHRLAAIGIPLQYRSEVITAVTTGSISGQAASAERSRAIAAIVHKVVAAAYGAFSTGLDISLSIAAALMLVAGIAAARLVRSVSPRRVRESGGSPAATAI